MSISTLVWINRRNNWIWRQIPQNITRSMTLFLRNANKARKVRKIIISFLIFKDKKQLLSVHYDLSVIALSYESRLSAYCRDITNCWSVQSTLNRINLHVLVLDLVSVLSSGNLCRHVGKPGFWKETKKSCTDFLSHISICSIYMFFLHNKKHRLIVYKPDYPRWRHTLDLRTRLAETCHKVITMSLRFFHTCRMDVFKSQLCN